VPDYLAARGVLTVLPDGALGEVLRCHPACPFGGQRIQCMIALVRNIHTNVPQAIHRTAIEHEADGSIRTQGVRRMALGPIKNGAIKLTDNADVMTCLGIGEGVESTLSLRRHPLFMTSPVWALISAGGIQAFPALAGIEVLLIAVDNDKPDLRTGKRAGQDAAKECSERWTGAGREVFRITSKAAGEDLNDVARRAVQ
jgi:hypothetical protein